MSRYPYTHAADLIRAIAGQNKNGAKISRGEASRIRQKISDIIGMKDEEVARKLADYYLKNEEEIVDTVITDFMVNH